MSSSGDSTPILLTHPLDSQELLNAAMMAQEEVEDAAEDVQELNTEIEAAMAAERKKKQNSELLAAIQAALQGNTEAMEIFGANQLNIQDGDANDSGDVDDEDVEEVDEQNSESFFSWLHSSVLPTSMSTIFTRRALTAYSKYYAYKAGRYAWNLTTASALLLLPLIIAGAAEDGFISQAMEISNLQNKMAEFEQRGILPASPAYNIPSKAPPGYAPPPADVAGIPMQ